MKQHESSCSWCGKPECPIRRPIQNMLGDPQTDSRVRMNIDLEMERRHLELRVTTLELEVKRAKFREGEYRDGLRSALRSYGCSEWLTDTAMTAIEKSVEKKAQEITS